MVCRRPEFKLGLHKSRYSYLFSFFSIRADILICSAFSASHCMLHICNIWHQRINNSKLSPNNKDAITVIKTWSTSPQPTSCNDSATLALYETHSFQSPSHKLYSQHLQKLQTFISHKHQEIITIVQTINTSMKEALLEVGSEVC